MRDGCILGIALELLSQVALFTGTIRPLPARRFPEAATTADLRFQTLVGTNSA